MRDVSGSMVFVTKACLGDSEHRQPVPSRRPMHQEHLLCYCSYRKRPLRIGSRYGYSTRVYYRATLQVGPREEHLEYCYCLFWRSEEAVEEELQIRQARVRQQGPHRVSDDRLPLPLPLPLKAMMILIISYLSGH